METLIRIVAPRNRLDLLFKSMALVITFVVFDHYVEMWTEAFRGENHMRALLVTVLSAAPFALFVMTIMARQRQLQLELATLAATDVLTGLRNRRAFFADTAAKLTDGQSGFVFLADADHFKAINDAYGHDVGDQCLIEIATRLREIAGDDHIVGRIGGEEFAIFVPHDDQPLSAQQFGDAICEAITVTLKDRLEPLYLTLSAGAVMLNGSRTLADAINHADRALYAAKADGRARCVVLRDGARVSGMNAA